ncbi:MAG: SpoIIIAH-like family protein [Oscillospiraceae bacterium]|nr:SpoIIIAH-like family protein [Oscillospiraceae bacterium]
MKVRKNLKRNLVMAAVLLFVCAAVYLNWSYSARYGEADAAMTRAEDAHIEAAAEQYTETAAEEEKSAEQGGAYFASARLTRQQSRDKALSLLETAAAGEGASQETIDAAMDSIAAMATWSMQETQIENLLLAKDFSDCVVYLSAEGVTVAVPAPVEGLSEAAVARITDTITTETGLSASQLRIIEVREN